MVLRERLMDDLDRRIVQALCRNGREKISAIARRFNVPATTVQERVRRLESRGVIRGYRAIVDQRHLGFTVQALVGLSLDRHEANQIRNFEKAVRSVSCIKSCYHVSGRFDYILHVVAEDLDALGTLVKTQIAALPDFGRCETFIIFSETESAPPLLSSLAGMAPGTCQPQPARR